MNFSLCENMLGFCSDSHISRNPYKTNRFLVAHTEQEICAIIWTSLFCIDKTCFPRPGHICDWICKNWSKLHKNWNSFYCWTLKLNSCAIPRNAKHIYSYRRPCLLSQTAFCCPCQTTKVHYRVLGPANSINKDVSGSYQCAADYCLDLSCRLSLFLSLTEDTALLFVS